MAKASASGDIQRMMAEGDVYYVRPQQSARGDRADYKVAQDSVTFTGNVVVASDENVIRGETLVLQIGTRQTTIRAQRPASGCAACSCPRRPEPDSRASIAAQSWPLRQQPLTPASRILSRGRSDMSPEGAASRSSKSKAAQSGLGAVSDRKSPIAAAAW